MRRTLPAAFLCSLLSFGLFLGAAHAQDPLVVGYTNLQSSKIPVPLAREAGLFSKHGLRVELIRVTPGNMAIPKLLSGEIDLFLGNGDPVVKAIVKEGAALSIIASLGEDSFRLAARSSIRAAADLKGKRIGVSNPGSSADRIARLALARLGFNPDQDVRIVATGLNESKARLELLLKGEIDATIVSTENLVALAGRRGEVSEIAELEELGIYVSGSDLSATRQLIESRRSVVKRFLAAVMEAITMAKKDLELTKKIYREHARLDDEAALEWRTREFVPKRIPAVPYPNQRAIAVYLSEAGERDSVKIEAVADLSLLREVANAR